MISGCLVAILTGCAGWQMAGPTSPAAVTGQNDRRLDLAGFGARPGYIFASRSVVAGHHARSLSKAGGDLYVSDGGLQAVAVFSNMGWGYVGEIGSNLVGADRDWVDKKGNLYVANCCVEKNIVEYDPAGSLIFTYSDGLTNPITVTTDRKGNVYAGDYSSLYHYYSYGDVVEYAQESNNAEATCFVGDALGSGTEGIAVDKKGDVFVSYNSNAFYGPGYLVEYKHGLRGCRVTALGITLGFAGGIALDKNANLLVVDQSNTAIDVVAPPYTSISGTFGSNLYIPFGVTINKSNTQAYVVTEMTSTAASFVDILSYPSGSLIKTLNSSDGLSEPYGAVDSQNFVP